MFLNDDGTVSVGAKYDVEEEFCVCHIDSCWGTPFGVQLMIISLLSALSALSAGSSDTTAIER